MNRRNFFVSSFLGFLTLIVLWSGFALAEEPTPQLVNQPTISVSVVASVVVWPDNYGNDSAITVRRGEKSRWFSLSELARIGRHEGNCWTYAVHVLGIAEVRQCRPDQFEVRMEGQKEFILTATNGSYTDPTIRLRGREYVATAVAPTIVTSLR